MYEIIFKYCLGLGLPLSRLILLITRKRLDFDSVEEFSYFISFAEKTKKTYNVKKGVGTDSATADRSWGQLQRASLRRILKLYTLIDRRGSFQYYPVCQSLKINLSSQMINTFSLILCTNMPSSTWDDTRILAALACKIFDTMISAILTYNSEIWGVYVKPDFKTWAGLTNREGTPSIL